MPYRNNGLMQLPFFNLPDHEFCNLIGSCTPSLSERLADNIDLLNVLPNPDKQDERDSDFMLVPPCSEYYEITKLNKLLNSSYSSRNCLSTFHCNIRSLPKNKQVLIGIFRTLEIICNNTVNKVFLSLNNTVHCKYCLLLEMLPVAVKQPVNVHDFCQDISPKRG